MQNEVSWGAIIRQSVLQKKKKKTRENIVNDYVIV